MLFIFGWGRQTVKKHGPVQRYHCDHCRNDEFWQLYTRRTWFTLFFIPVIPYSTEHLLLCPICNHGSQLSNAEFKELQPMADINMQLINKKITHEEHSARISQLISGVGSNASASPSGRTQTQENYIREMREIEEERRKQEATN